MNSMTGITIDEMCEKLGLSFKTVSARIYRAGLKPITRQALYAPDTIDIISNVTMGRPPKKAEAKKTRGKK